MHMTTHEAAKITRELLAVHGLDGWNVTFDNARRRAGACNYSRRLISLSKPLMAQRSREDTHSTITHEIAHALTPGHKHDRVWAAKHRTLGGDGKRCFEHHDETAPWVGTCEHGTKYARYRAPKRLEGWRCGCVRGGSPVVWERRDSAA
jgi:predicted SprT family Zn-dependent metalloprotease